MGVDRRVAGQACCNTWCSYAEETRRNLLAATTGDAPEDATAAASLCTGAMLSRLSEPRGIWSLSAALQPDPLRNIEGRVLPALVQEDCCKLGWPGSDGDIERRAAGRGCGAQVHGRRLPCFGFLQESLCVTSHLEECQALKNDEMSPPSMLRNGLRMMR